MRGNVDIIIAPKNYLYANTAYQTARGIWPSDDRLKRRPRLKTVVPFDTTD